MVALLDIPSIPAEGLRSSNQLFGLRRDISTSVGSHSVAVRLAKASTATPAMFVEVGLGDVTIYVGLEQPDSMPIQETFGFQNLSSLPPEMLLGCLECLFEDAATGIAEHIGASPKLTRSLPATELPDLPSVGLSLEWSDGTTHYGQVVTTPAGHELLSELVQRNPLGNTIDASTLTVEGRLEIGLSFLPIETLKQLEPGDVLIIENTFRDAPDSQAILSFPAPLPSWEVDLPKDGPATIDFTKQQASAAPDPTDQGLPVRFDWGSHPFSVQQLTELDSCGSFTPSATRVYVRCENQLIATGQLVSLGEKYGIRLGHVSQ